VSWRCPLTEYRELDARSRLTRIADCPVVVPHWYVSAFTRRIPRLNRTEIFPLFVRAKGGAVSVLGWSIGESLAPSPGLSLSSQTKASTDTSRQRGSNRDHPVPLQRHVSPCAHFASQPYGPGSTNTTSGEWTFILFCALNVLGLPYIYFLCTSPRLPSSIPELPHIPARKVYTPEPS
jgi:hypothetical protein